MPFHEVAAVRDNLPVPAADSQAQAAMNALAQRYGNHPPW